MALASPLKLFTTVAGDFLHGVSVVDVGLGEGAEGYSVVFFDLSKVSDVTDFHGLTVNVGHYEGEDARFAR